MRRYEILLEFVREETGGSKDAITWEKVADSMIYDLYLREKLKSHPSFEKDQKPYRESHLGIQAQGGDSEDCPD